jgi:hypothetical protein
MVELPRIGETSRRGFASDSLVAETIEHTPPESEMFARIFLVALAVHVAGTLAAPEVDAREPKDVKPIVEIEKVEPRPIAFEKSSAIEPLELKSVEEAAEIFAGKSLETLKRNVDFDEQIVLVFAWRGSGGDELKFDVAESFPEQVRFTYERGRTRDLRPHVVVHALRRNVKWSVAAPGR